MAARSFDVLYCGDTSLSSAASYLAGMLTHAGLSFHYVASDQAVEPTIAQSDWKLLILSDYPAAQLPKALQEAFVERVHRGAGLLMIGGWESFHGLGGDWDGTTIGNLLPVEIAKTDDRFNCDRPLVVKQAAKHAVVDGLPWETRPPLIGGLNRVKAKPHDELLLTAEQWDLKWDGANVDLKPVASHPLLVVGQRSHGRVGAFASDLAPHWVGPLVDWGTKRVTAKPPGGHDVEVGDLYAEFIIRLVKWTMGK